jgi:23S rRNA (cytosine1962-C5)-methyltransferase
MGKVWLKPGREKSLLRRHPWVFSGAIARVEGEAASPQPGETVDVLDAHGQFLARGALSPKSQIQVRIWTWDAAQIINREFFRKRLARALKLRQALIDPQATNAFRLVHAESDGLPGLVVDRYGEALIMQCLSSGVERWREELGELLVELTGCASLYERSDADVRTLEGLAPRSGAVFGKEPPELIPVSENGLQFFVDVRSGQKSGFYLDQRANRNRLRQLAAGREVLDCFAYTGGFTVAALAGGAQSVTAVDSSAAALSLASENIALNGFSAGLVSWVEGDVFQVLRANRDRGLSYDLIVLDPPKFASTSAQAQRAARGYKDINLLAFKLLRPGGLLFTFSCSGGVDADLFQKIVAGAALDAGVEARIVDRMQQGPDHPVALNFPEGAYLKGLVCYKSV